MLSVKFISNVVVLKVYDVESFYVISDWNIHMQTLYPFHIYIN